jgi:hypothetical protein
MHEYSKRKIEKFKKVYDEGWNEIGLKGSLSKGMKIYPERTKSQINPSVCRSQH